MVKLNSFFSSLNICKEVLDGIRIYFDFTLKDLLLYSNEEGQVQTQQAIFSSVGQSKVEEA